MSATPKSFPTAQSDARNWFLLRGREIRIVKKFKLSTGSDQPKFFAPCGQFQEEEMEGPKKRERGDRGKR